MTLTQALSAGTTPSGYAYAFHEGLGADNATYEATSEPCGRITFTRHTLMEGADGLPTPWTSVVLNDPYPGSHDWRPQNEEGTP